MTGKRLEIDFLLSVGRYGWAGRGFTTDPGLIRRQGHLDWSFLTSQLYRHRLMGLGWTMLIGPWSQAGGALPRGYALHQTWYSATAHRNSLMRQELHQLAPRLTEANVDVLLRRGPALIGDTYSDPGIRPMSDIDLLVRAGQEERFVSALQARGYTPGDLAADKRSIMTTTADDPLPRLLKPTNDTMLPFIIVDPETAFLPLLEGGPPALDVFAEARASRAGSTEIATMAPHHLVLDLCMHLHAESTTARFIRRGRHQRLLQYVDILAYLARHTFEWDRFLTACAGTGQSASAYYALANAARLYPNAPIPAAATRQLSATANVSEDFLDRYGPPDHPQRWNQGLTERLFTEKLPSIPPA